MEKRILNSLDEIKLLKLSAEIKVLEDKKDFWENEKDQKVADIYMRAIRKYGEVI